MMKIRDYLDTLDIRDGDSVRMDCPSCRSRNTFSCFKDGGDYVYNCFKLSCGLRGAYSTDMTAAEIKLRMSKTEPSKNKEIEALVYPEYVVQPTSDHVLLQSFIDKYDLQHEGLMYDVKDRRAVFPIHYKGKLIDAVGRALDGAIPKWYRYSGNADYFTKRTNSKADVAVVVEDVISAIKVVTLYAQRSRLCSPGYIYKCDNYATARRIQQGDRSVRQGRSTQDLAIQTRDRAMDRVTHQGFTA